MLLKVNTKEIAAYPDDFRVIPMDFDDADASVRMADATLNRDRIAVKRQIEMSFGLLTWPEISALLQSMSGVFFDFYYPDPMTGAYATKKFYVGNRPAGVAVDSGGVMSWEGLKITLTEQ